MNKFLKIEGLSKSFQSGSEKLHILVDLALEVEEGQMVAVTGASGSGKSTFLHLVGGMERADSGQILFEGTEVTRLAGRELAKLRNEKIGFIFQFHHLLPEFSALENVMFPLLLRRIPLSQAAERGRTSLAEVGLSERIHHKPGELSGGEQQRVAVARALVGKPRLLLGDEPTGNLDTHTSEKIYELLLGVHRRHRLTSIIATHNPRLASLCDVEKRLREGKLVDP
ncbi:ABC transporter ATP-binding protein [Acidobacteria bacterium AH-259-O06]|nr:ABC transporter ATP-binding protein [Acidobacteria bacterium AH-259-L09]MDA2930482.1 ABC transporter ATP-binding protein [Acidobacteria bacterium AH-259-O06]